jgi:hypothetical protein
MYGVITSTTAAAGMYGRADLRVSPVQRDEHLLMVLRYVLQNPIRSGLAGSVTVCPDTLATVYHNPASLRSGTIASRPHERSVQRPAGAFQGVSAAGWAFRPHGTKPEKTPSFFWSQFFVGPNAK